jgi:hypothetical protein
MRRSISLLAAAGLALAAGAPTAIAQNAPQPASPAEQPAPAQTPPAAAGTDADQAATSDSAPASLSTGPLSMPARPGRPAADRGALFGPGLTPPKTSVDLFPPSVFTVPGSDFGPGMSGGGKRESRAGLGLGNDGDWRVQAAQIGAMAVGFAALAALCGGARCLLPESTSSWLPDAFQPKGPATPVIRPAQQVRQIR